MEPDQVQAHKSHTVSSDSGCWASVTKTAPLRHAQSPGRLRDHRAPTTECDPVIELNLPNPERQRGLQSGRQRHGVGHVRIAPVAERSCRRQRARHGGGVTQVPSALTCLMSARSLGAGRAAGGLGGQKASVTLMSPAGQDIGAPPSGVTSIFRRSSAQGCERAERLDQPRGPQGALCVGRLTIRSSSGPQ